MSDSAQRTTQHSTDTDTDTATTRDGELTTCDAVIVGAGLAGLYMLHRLRGLGLSVRVFEAGSGPGGTWFWNRYPGARCDIESMEYSYQFSDELQQEWEWSERYATQPEILKYINHVADRFDLRREIDFDTRVDAMHFDEQSHRWKVATSRGEQLSSQYCVMATGCLSSTNTPDFEGLDSFAGSCFHTGDWPHEGVDFSGQRVGIIGTGSSAIQSIPLIAEQAEHLYVFQRTPNFSVPAHNGPLDPGFVKETKEDYAGFRARNSASPAGFGSAFPGNEGSVFEASEAERQAAFEARWEHGGLQFLGAYGDLMLNSDANDVAADFVRTKIGELVDDPAVAEALSPKQVVGCKRLCVDTGYYQTFNRPNVTLVDISEGEIDKITPDGLIANGDPYELDALVLATGFDAMTGALLAVDIRGRGGQTLGQKWSEGPRTYLGLASVGFPNLFTITGPGSPSVLSNMIPSIEQHVNWITDCVAYLREHEIATIEPTLEAEDQWVAVVNMIAGVTLYPHCNSWYLGANVPGKPRVFMPFLGVPPYAERCREVATNGYEGFDLTPRAAEIGSR